MNNNELFEKYIMPELDYIKHVCWKYWDKTTEFEDLHSNVLADLLSYIHTYDSSKPIRPWLYTAIRHDMVRFQKRQWASPIDYVDLEQYPYSHISVVDNRNSYDDIHAAIESLSPLHYEIISLRMKGYKIAEVATMLYEQGRVAAESVNIIKFRIKEAYN